MTSKLPEKRTNAKDIQTFLGNVKSSPLVTTLAKGRLVFAMDATASREECWDMASQKHAEMFTQADKANGLSVQLCYYRGMDNFTALEWKRSADEVKDALLTVRCLAGQTQIAKVLKHALKETRKEKVNAVVFVGDCMEEDPDTLGALAGELGILNLPIFIFQEGSNAKARSVFSQLATLSGGAYCQFDEGSAKQLGQLLAAVAVYAGGGKAALEKHLLSDDSGARLLLGQLK
jgi:hypothetical protein